MKAFDPNYKLLDEMYQDDYYPAFLVDKVKDEIQKVIDLLESGETDTGRYAARRWIPRRHLRRGSVAGAVRDERVRRSARDVRAVVCTRCSNVCKRGVYIRVSAARRRADRTGGADIPARAGHHVRRVLDVRRGLRTAARRKRLAQTSNAFGADRNRAFIAFGYQSVRRNCSSLPVTQFKAVSW